MTPSGRAVNASRSTRTRLLAGVGLIVLVGGFAAIVFSGEGSSVETVPAATTPSTTTPSPTPPKPKRKIVRIPVKGIGAYDPDGDRSENDSAASLATDGVLSTAWKSERYRRSFAKTGIGLVLDAGRPVRANRVVVATETPGYTADVRVGSSPVGPFVSVSKEQSLEARTRFALTPRSGRYLMLWITSMPEDGAAAVNEITASGAR
jgi:hypothetical protein